MILAKKNILISWILFYFSFNEIKINIWNTKRVFLQVKFVLNKNIDAFEKLKKYKIKFYKGC